MTHEFQAALSNYSQMREHCTDQRVVDSGDVAALVWRQKKQTGVLPTDQRKLYVLTKHSEKIEELSFGETAKHVFDWSSRGQFCLSATEKRSL